MRRTLRHRPVEHEPSLLEDRIGSALALAGYAEHQLRTAEADIRVAASNLEALSDECIDLSEGYEALGIDTYRESFRLVAVAEKLKALTN